MYGENRSNLGHAGNRWRVSHPRPPAGTRKECQNFGRRIYSPHAARHRPEVNRKV